MSADALKDAWLAGNITLVNQLVAQQGVTAAQAATRYGLPASSIATMRAAGVRFVGDAGGAPAGTIAGFQLTPPVLILAALGVYFFMRHRG